MGYLVEYHSYRGRDSYREANQVRRCDDHSIDQIVDRISEQIHVTDGAYGGTRFQSVLMSPKEKLLEAEE
jgi:hypothetical protein